MSHNIQPSGEIQYWKKPIGINDANNVPVSEAAAAELRRDATQNLMKLPSELCRLDIGSVWERSAVRSKMEYWVLDCAAECIDILKALNLSDRDDMLKKAKEKRDESKPGILMAVKYWVCPIEMKETRENMRDLRQRRCRDPRVSHCIPEIQQSAPKWHPNRAPSLTHLLNAMEKIMDKVRATAEQLETDSPDGHWALKLLQFYSDGWIVWLREFGRDLECFGDFIDEDVERTKQRAKLAEEIVKEVEKEKENR